MYKPDSGFVLRKATLRSHSASLPQEEQKIPKSKQACYIVLSVTSARDPAFVGHYTLDSLTLERSRVSSLYASDSQLIYLAHSGHRELFPSSVHLIEGVIRDRMKKGHGDRASFSHQHVRSLWEREQVSCCIVNTKKAQRTLKKIIILFCCVFHMFSCRLSRSVTTFHLLSHLGIPLGAVSIHIGFPLLPWPPQARRKETGKRKDCDTMNIYAPEFFLIYSTGLFETTLIFMDAKQFP